MRFYLNLNVAWTIMDEAKLNWNTMETKIKRIGIKIMVQTFRTESHKIKAIKNCIFQVLPN